MCKARRALVLVLLRKADPVEDSGNSAHSVSLTIRLPSVLRLNYYVHVRRRDVPLTKRNVLRRDRGTCQYCGTRVGEMTTDHVVPKALGGEDAWENLVCACSGCNARKGNRTPVKAGMQLLGPPKKPHYFSFTVSAMGQVPDVWRQYLFQS